MLCSTSHFVTLEVLVLARRRTVVPLALALLALTGCAGTDIGPDAGGPTPSTSREATDTASPSPTPAPTPTDTPADGAPTAAVPTDCKDIVNLGVYEDVFANTPLNPEGFTTRSGEPFGQITPTTPPPGATPEEVVRSATTLDCLWRNPEADVTGIEVALATVDPAVGNAYLASLAEEGYECTEVHEGRRCHLTERDAQYPVDNAYTRFLRDDVLISVDQSNFPTDDLLGDIVDRIWG